MCVTKGNTPPSPQRARRRRGIWEGSVLYVAGPMRVSGVSEYSNSRHFRKRSVMRT